jgi:hypothetical protein
MNRAWHEKNVLGQKAPLARRVAWHLAHQENCSCRPIPKTIQSEIKKENKKP